MCFAVREWEAEARRISREEGRTIIVRNRIRRGDSDEEIAQVVECDREYVARVRRSIKLDS